MKRSLVAVLLGGLMLVPFGASAQHRGCTVTPNEPRCTYTAVGGEIARGGASSTANTAWEAWVIRQINGVPTKVVLAGESSLLDADPEGHPVPANAGEVVTLDLLGGSNGNRVGLVNIGLDTNHP